MNSMLSQRRHAFLIALAIVLYVFAFAGSRGLYSPDEGRYTNVAIEMLRSGDFIHPHLSAAYEHYTKPPLTYWAIAASLKVFGFSEWAARLPYGLSLLVQLLCLHGIGRRLTPERSWLPPLVYATTLVPYMAATAVTPDMLLATCTTLYGYAFVAARASAAKHAGYVALLWLGVGLAFLESRAVEAVGLRQAADDLPRRRLLEQSDGLGRGEAEDGPEFVPAFGADDDVVAALVGAAVGIELAEESRRPVADDPVDWHGCSSLLLDSL